MKTICYLETDETGEIEWGEGCISTDPTDFKYSFALVNKAEVDIEIAKLKQRISDMGWQLNPDRMGS